MGRKLGWKCAKEVMSLKPVKCYANQAQTVLAMDLSSSSFYYQPYLMGIMIIKHLCCCKLKKGNTFFSIQQAAWSNLKWAPFQVKAIPSVCSANGETTWRAEWVPSLASAVPGTALGSGVWWTLTYSTHQPHCSQLWRPHMTAASPGMNHLVLLSCFPHKMAGTRLLQCLSPLVYLIPCRKDPMLCLICLHILGHWRLC